MTTTTKALEPELPELPKPDNSLADQWRKEFIEDLTKRRSKLVLSANGCQEGGWYRRQLEMQIALYDAALSAIAATQEQQEPQARQEPIGFITDDDLEDLKKHGVSTIYASEQKRQFGPQWGAHALYAAPVQQDNIADAQPNPKTKQQGE